MSDWIRRDLEQFVNNNGIGGVTNSSSSEKMPRLFKDNIAKWIKDDNVYSADSHLANAEAVNKCATFFGISNKNLLIFPSVLDSVDYILKTFLELYENVLLKEPCNEIFKDLVYVNRGKANSISVENINTQYLEIIEQIRAKNAKLLFISSRTSISDNLIAVDIVKEIALKTPNIVVIDDSNNDFRNDTFTNLALNFKNIIIIKSFSETNDFNSIKSSVIVASEEIISDINKIYNNHLDTLTSMEMIFALEHVSLDIPFEEVVQIEQISKKEYVEAEKVDNIEMQNEQIDIEDVEIEDNTSELSDILEEDEVKPIDSDDRELTSNKDTSANRGRLIPGDRLSLINEITKYKFISIFSTNAANVYILSRIEIYNILVDEGINIKKYNSSQGEILRLTIDRTKENERILDVLDTIDERHMIYVSSE